MPAVRRIVDRRAALGLLAGGAAAGLAGTAAARPADLSGVVVFAGGTAIPPGRLELRVEGAADDGTRRRDADAVIESDGRSKSIAFSLPAPGGPSAPAAGTAIVARLERGDGWLLARGSARADADAGARITLYAAMY